MQQTKFLKEKIVTHENHFKFYINDDRFCFKRTKYP